MTEANQQIVLMYSSGSSPAGQYHLPNGQTLFPVQTAVDGGSTTNCFAVPLQFRQQAAAAGLVTLTELPNKLSQGTSAERPIGVADGTQFFDLTLGTTVVFQSYQSKWVLPESWIQSGPTSSRPTGTATNSFAAFGTKLKFYDTTIAQLISWSGTAWVNSAGTAV